MRKYTYFYRYWIVLLILSAAGIPVHLSAQVSGTGVSVPPDTTNLPYPFNDETISNGKGSQLYLKDPSNVKTTIEYDPETRQYVKVYKIGKLTYRIPVTMSFEEYQQQDMDNTLQQYWKERSETASMNNGTGMIPKIHIGGKVFETIFGNNTVDIRPQGSAEISLGVVSNKRDDPMLNSRQRRQTNLDLDEKIQMNVIAKIGDKIEFKTSYNTEATFDFENKLKLKYEGKEDDIIQLLEGGDVNFPLNSTLIHGTESLFGLKTKLRFGRVTVTALYSQQKSETKNITVQGNAQTTQFTIKADEYEENKHFFIAQYFRDNYKKALKDLPVVTSNINILKMEVWVTNIGAAVTENRNIVAFQDLGEANPYSTDFHKNPLFPYPYPENASNDLYSVLFRTPADSVYMRNINKVTDYLKGSPFFLTSGQDFEKVESARKLLPSEYVFNPKLGFISLNTALNPDQVLAVAYQYQVVGDDSIYQVGEFSNEGIQSPNNLIVKLLKSTTVNTRLPIWKLMMKNVYSLGAYQIQPQDFTLNILYSGNKNGVPTAYITEGRISGVPLLRVLNLDNLDQNLNPPGDGMFDFLDNAATGAGTIQSSNGRIYFTVLEPFGQDLRDSIIDPDLANKYCYDSLYTMTKTNARQYPEKNKFVLDGFYKSSTGSEISLNALNVPQGSVRVTAGGVPLVENVDYTVDYTLGRVRITNEGILNSGTPINISLESTQMFNIQTKRLMAAHVDYKISKDFFVGATIMNLNERPLTQKVNYGDEPMSNTMWGLNLTYRTQSRLLTRLVDALPFITTKAVSNVSVDAEFAHFIPGHSKAIGKTGTTYIDDFEGTQSTIDLKNTGSWFLASTPQNQTTVGMFPEAAQGTGLSYGFNRAKLAWYIIDQLFYDKNNSLVPKNVNNTELSNQYVRQVWETEIFPNKEPLNGIPVNLPVLNLAYYPDERGPYNYDNQGTSFSKGIDVNGKLVDPESRWGGIMRRIETSDFEATNIQYIEFWMMDPFVYDSTNSGDLYFNLGDISEDILRDGRKAFENGLPTSALVKDVDTTIWGRVPNQQALVDAFDNNTDSRPFQDVGYDGLKDSDERTFFQAQYIAGIESRYGAGSNAYVAANNDPSGDNFHYFLGADYDADPIYGSILMRYKQYNGPDGNSPVSTGNTIQSSSTIPNVEDINKDNTLSETERYYQYVIHLSPDKMKAGENFITNVYKAVDIPLANGQRGTVKWYQFKIPVHNPDKVVGNIQDFTSIRFLRMFFKNFQRPVVARFATLELSRGEWRKYAYDLLQPGEYNPNANENETTFDISTVNIEENGNKQPIPYIMPPGIERETNWGSTNQQKLNEQSMVIKVCNLLDGDARATYKTTEFDFRQFKKLQMFVHAERTLRNQAMKKGDVTVFVRIGSDFTQNYYEYEIPLTFTEWGTSPSDVYGIWPEDNAFDIDFDQLVQVKQNRNVAMRGSGTTVSTGIPYVEYIGKNKVTVLGSPTISDVKSIMIGVRNPRKGTNDPDDDGQEKCAEIWVDELRLTDFNTKGGWAATARVAADLADLGRIQMQGSYSSDGFGSIEQKQTQRQMESMLTYGFDTDLELGKFFPEKSGIRVPVHFDYSIQRNTPQYDPLNPDVLFKEELKSFETREQRDSVRAIREDYTQRKNFNLVNLRKDRMGDKKPKIWDIENFNASYAYSEIYHRNIDIEFDMKKKYTGGIGYNFAANPKNIAPFGKSKMTRYKSLRLITDLNFYYLPKSFAFRTDMNREYNERQFRNKSLAIIPMETFYIKRWDWSRLYDLKYDLAKSVRFTLSANVNSFINEPPGKIDRSDREVIWNEIWGLGTMTNYNQQFTGQYDLPFSKIGIIDWVQVMLGYQAGYHWTASSLEMQRKGYGNTIENSQGWTVNGTLTFTKLYDKVPYLKKINQKGQKPPQRATTQKDKAQKMDTLQPTKNSQFGKNLLEGTLRVLMGIRKATVNYVQGSGITMPGFVPKPGIMGNNWADGGMGAPGLGFIFGSQEDISAKAAENHWLTTNTNLNLPYWEKYNDNFTYTVSVEPINDLRIEINGLRTTSNSHQDYFKYKDSLSLSTPEHYSPKDIGSFTMSYIMIGTSFKSDTGDNFSPLFEQMKAYRYDVAMRYSMQNPNSAGRIDSTGYPVGYGQNQQDVLLTSFIASYTGRDPAKIKLNPFPSFPLPNWRITYDGLAKIKSIKKVLRTLTLSHAYISTYTISGYESNPKYQEIDGGASYIDETGNFIPKQSLNVISITEQFNPMLKIDMGWVNSLLSNIEWKRGRNLSFSFANNQLTEIWSNEFIVGLGYRFKNIKLSFISLGMAGKGSKYSSDLALKLDFGLRKNKTMLRRIEENINQISTGQQVMTLDFTADYNISQRFNIRFYFKKNINSPYVSNQYRISNTSGGLTLRFTLSQ